MRKTSSLKSLKTRGKSCRTVARRNRQGKRVVFVIDPNEPRNKARQG